MERGTVTVPRPDVKDIREPANQCSRARISRPLINRITTSASSGDGAASVSAVATETSDVARQLRARVLAFIGAPSDDDFDTLALDVHAYQYRANPAYRRYVDRVGAVAPRSWRDVPAVPAEAFRLSVLACAPAERVYQSSGTTAGPERRAHHHVPDVAIYHAAALAGFRRAVLPADARRRFLVAAPERATHPASSLGEMVTWLREAHDSGTAPSLLRADGVDLAGLAAALDGLEPDVPVVLLAVTSALLRLGDWAEAQRRAWRLPAGSLVVDTGGCKGYARQLARAAIVDRYRQLLGVTPEEVVNEYGMTELGSQLYARGAGAHVAPPWLRTLVCEPASGREVAPGEIGCLRHVDLVNVGSVLAVQTEDLGRAVAGGIELLGRAPGAVTRGCSLLAHTS